MRKEKGALKRAAGTKKKKRTKTDKLIADAKRQKKSYHSNADVREKKQEKNTANYQVKKEKRKMILSLIKSARRMTMKIQNEAGITQRIGRLFLRYTPMMPIKFRRHWVTVPSNIILPKHAEIVILVFHERIPFLKESKLLKMN